MAFKIATTQESEVEVDIESGRSNESFEGSSAQEAISPSLRSDHDGVAFEIKFLLPTATAEAVIQRARQQMRLDPHCDPEMGEAYEVHGLYFDTSEFHVYHRVETHSVNKLRLRRYGRMSSVFLEHKAKVKGRVRKRRTSVSEGEIPILSSQRPSNEWTGAWFQKRMRLRRLRPMCEISYLRTAFIGGNGAEAYRLTLDRQLRCRPFSDWTVRGVDDGTFVLNDQMILELKFCDVMPAFFKGLLADLQLSPQRVSKYRMSVEACGLISPTAAPPSAADFPPDIDDSQSNGADGTNLRSA